jgi:hypothetical protein
MVSGFCCLVPVASLSSCMIPTYTTSYVHREVHIVCRNIHETKRDKKRKREKRKEGLQYPQRGR